MWGHYWEVLIVESCIKFGWFTVISVNVKFLHHKVPLEDINVISRIHYKAPSDEKWGEHEIDYVLFIQKDVNIEMNPNEVKSFCFVDQKKMKDILQDAEDKKIIITPWFDLLCKNFLFKWWDNLTDLEKIKDVKTIHKMIDD
jgi:isopentenyl-diphosphate delta-isomerase